MVVFLILHYIDEKMTQECVASLRKCIDFTDNKIVIVDNASPNGSGNRLKELYRDVSYCHVLLNDTNLGYARGNNIGYQYINENFAPDFIVIMNNDLIIDDENFILKVKKIYSEKNFYIMGPDIISKFTGVHQNPLRTVPLNEQDVKKMIKRFDILLKFPLASYVKSRIFNIISKGTQQNDNINYKNNMTDVVLHGACYIVSRNFISKESKIFDDRTFLYFEEDILYYRYKCKKYSMIYEPEISVLHYEDVSTKATYNLNNCNRIISEIKKRNFMFKEKRKSAYVMLSIMKDFN